MVSAGGSVALTALMSLAFNGRVRGDMVITGLVCGVVMERAVGGVARSYRRQLAGANAALEQRVLERTAALEAANASLREAAAAEARLRDELLVSERLASAGVLAAGVSHEIRSPLQALGLGLEELADDATAAMAPVIADLRAAVDHIGVVAADLSSLARPPSEAVGPVALAPVVASAVRLARYQCGRGVAVRTGAVTATPVVGNAARLVQVLLNLLVNAARAAAAERPNHVEVTARDHGDAVVVAVTDTGTGMSPEVQARLFTPFFTTGRERGGTGLGLMVCRSIVDRLGGAIAVRSQAGRGTEVEVTLRRTDDQGAGTRRPHAASG